MFRKSNSWDRYLSKYKFISLFFLLLKNFSNLFISSLEILKLISLSRILKFLNFILFSISFFFKGITLDWRCLFCNGELSTSNSKYDPPCKSKPKFIFFLNKY